MQVDFLTSDRKAWRGMIESRMRHKEHFEQEQRHKCEWPNSEQPFARNNIAYTTQDTEGFRCDYDNCRKVCLSKDLLTIHQRRVH